MAKWGKCDFSDLEDFQKDLKNLDMKDFQENLIKEIAARLLELVIPETPVKEDYPEDSGKVGGTLRRAWTCYNESEAQNGIERSINDYLNGLSVVKKGNYMELTIDNPTRYASFVEYGHRQTPGRYVPAIGKRLVKSWVQGKFMLKIAEDKIKVIYPKLAEQKLLEFVRGVGK